MSNSNLHLNDILWYVPFLDLMSTNYKTVIYNNGLISSAFKNSDLELGRVSFVLDTNEKHITRITMSLPIAILLYLGYYCTMYLIFWVIMNSVAFFLNSCMTKYQLQLQTLVHRIYQVEDFFKPDVNYGSKEVMSKHEELRQLLRSLNVFERMEWLLYKYSLFKYWKCCGSK